MVWSNGELGAEVSTARGSQRVADGNLARDRIFGNNMVNLKIKVREYKGKGTPHPFVYGLY